MLSVVCIDDILSWKSQTVVPDWDGRRDVANLSRYGNVHLTVAFSFLLLSRVLCNRPSRDDYLNNKYTGFWISASLDYGIDKEVKEGLPSWVEFWVKMFPTWFWKRNFFSLRAWEPGRKIELKFEAGKLETVRVTLSRLKVFLHEWKQNSHFLKTEK